MVGPARSMIEAIKEMFADFKADMSLYLREYGIFPVIGILFLFFLIVLICFPFFLVGVPFYLFNEWSKSWVENNSASEVSGNE